VQALPTDTKSKQGSLPSVALNSGDDRCGVLENQKLHDLATRELENVHVKVIEGNSSGLHDSMLEHNHGNMIPEAINSRGSS
jgi:hypothetical protein